MAKEFKIRARRILKNQSIEMDRAGASSFVKIPVGTTAELAALPRKIATIAYDQDQAVVVVDDGNSFVPVGVGDGANKQLSNLQGPTDINEDLKFTEGFAPIIQTADDANGSTNLVIRSGDSATESGDVEIASGSSPDSGHVILNAPQIDINGQVLMNNEAWIKARNAANDDQVNIIRVNSSDEVEFDVQPVFGGSPIATEEYVDTVTQPLGPYAVKGVSNINIDLAVAADPNPIDTSLTLSNGNKILLVGQSDATENGVYNAVNATDPTTWVRADGWTQNSDFVNGRQIYSFDIDGEFFGATLWAVPREGLNIGSDNINFRLIGYRPSNLPQIPVYDGDPVATEGSVEAKFQVFASNPSAGGSATEALTVIDLLSTDTILSVSQQTPGANSEPIIGHSTLVNDGLTIQWPADPGVGAIVIVCVKR